MLPCALPLNLAVVPLSAVPLSRGAGEGERAARRTPSTPLSHAVGEGLGVRAKNSRRAPYEGFSALETLTDIILLFSYLNQPENSTCPLRSIL